MALFGLLHHHPGHRARRLRWVLPLVGLGLVAVLATLAVQYEVSNQSVGREFFRAHKTITHTGELLQRGMVIGSVVLTPMPRCKSSPVWVIVLCARKNSL